MSTNHKMLALLVLLVCAATGARAQDMFVRPTNQAAHPVDLGIGVKPTPPTQPTAQPSPNVATAPSQQVPVQPKPIQQQPVQQAPPTPQPVAPPQPSYPPLQPDGTVDIIKVNETPVSVPAGNGAYTFNIAMQPGAVGQKEVNDIYKHLGLTPQEVAQNCAYETMVILSMGEKNGSAIMMGQTAAATQKFNIPLTGIDVVPTLACKKLRAPISGSIIEQGAYYKIGAGNVSCPVPNSGSVNLAFRYLGNGRGDCQYR